MIHQTVTCTTVKEGTKNKMTMSDRRYKGMLIWHKTCEKNIVGFGEAVMYATAIQKHPMGNTPVRPALPLLSSFNSTRLRIFTKAVSSISSPHPSVLPAQLFSRAYDLKDATPHALKATMLYLYVFAGSHVESCSLLFIASVAPGVSLLMTWS